MDANDYQSGAQLYITDHQGSVTMLIDAAGTRTAAYRYTVGD